jgi:asparagine synthase (glutamine-hydrolysing)
MSVQAGIWNLDGRPVDRRLLADFSDSLKEQGPDGETCHVDTCMALLYRPFHTTAESRREKQPHFSRRGFILTWDGRLDNRQDLICYLHSDLEADPTDVEIVTAAFDRWESGCFQRIIGDWAVSVWRPDRRELFFAVDYMAIRHIFYYLKKDRIFWATDLTPLVLLSGDKFRIDDNFVAGYFAHDPDPHLTPYREIREVPPGQFVRVNDGKAIVERYWRFSPKSRIRYTTDAEYEDHFRHLFRQSVRRRLRSDSSVLAELSGGLDSSSIVCMADDIIAKEGAQTPRLDTLSYYDTTEPNGDDWTYLQKVEEKRGRSGTHIDASSLGGSPASLECSTFQPLPGDLGFGRELEAERAAVVQRGAYRVVLSGVGGDEFLGGVPDPREQLADLIMQFRLVALAQQLIAWSLVKRRPWIQLFFQASGEFLPTALRQYLAKGAKVEPWIERKFAKRNRIGIRMLDVGENFGFWLPTRRSYISGVLFMAQKMAKWESSKLACEEVRYPYLDRNLVEFILSIPASQLLRPGERRSLMRRSLVGCVPLEILSRRTKQVSARTPTVALGKNIEQLTTVFNSPVSSSMGYINQNQFQQQLRAVRGGKEVNLVRLLKTIALEFWLRDLISRSLLIDMPRAPQQILGSTTQYAQPDHHTIPNPFLTK